jgi:hypothetical protein
VIDEALIESRGPHALTMNDIKQIEYLLNTDLSCEVADFLWRFSDTSPVKCYYEYGDIYACVAYFCGKSDINPNIFALIDGNKFYEYHGWLPFAIDPGGWVFNLSIRDDQTHGQVWIHRFDSGEPDPFAYVAPSFQAFLRGLTAV